MYRPLPAQRGAAPARLCSLELLPRGSRAQAVHTRSSLPSSLLRPPPCRSSAGNNKWDVDTSPVYPSKYNIPGLVAVAGTNTSDMLEPRRCAGRGRAARACLREQVRAPCCLRSMVACGGMPAVSALHVPPLAPLLAPRPRRAVEVPPSPSSA